MHKLWPHSGFELLGPLDNVFTLYEKHDLLGFAKALDGTQPLQHSQRVHIADVLRRLAAKPAGLRLLNRERPTAPRSVVGLNRAIHYQVCAELLGKGKSKRARAQVARAWHVSDGTVRDDMTDHGARARLELESIVGLVLKRPGAPDRRSFLSALDRDMKHRATKVFATR